MHGMLRPLALAAAAGALTGVTPETRYPPELLAQLDPSVLMASLCTGERAGGAIRAKLALAAQVAPAADAFVTKGSASPPLYGGLGGVHVPITTASREAQRY